MSSPWEPFPILPSFSPSGEGGGERPRRHDGDRNACRAVAARTGLAAPQCSRVIPASSTSETVPAGWRRPAAAGSSGRRRVTRGQRAAVLFVLFDLSAAGPLSHDEAAAPGTTGPPSLVMKQCWPPELHAKHHCRVAGAFVGLMRCLLALPCRLLVLTISGTTIILMGIESGGGGRDASPSR